MSRPMHAASDYHDIPFLQNVVLTDLINNLPVQGALMGNQLIPDQNVPTRIVEWEATYGGRNIAPIVAMDAASPLVKRPGIDRHRTEAVDIRQKSYLDEGTILFLRQPGTREQSAGRTQVTRDLARMRADTESRMEKMRFDAMLSGSINETLTVDGETLVYFHDFKIPAAQRWNANVLWTVTSSSDPRIEFRRAKKQEREATGRRITQAWMNTNTHELMDRSEILRSEFRSVSTNNGDVVKDQFATDVVANVRVVDYDEGYKEDVNWGGTFKYYLPDNKVIFAVGANDGGEPFADFAIAPSALADGSVVDRFFAETWTQPDPTREYLRAGIVGIPRIFHPDWIITATVG